MEVCSWFPSPPPLLSHSLSLSLSLSVSACLFLSLSSLSFSESVSQWVFSCVLSLRLPVSLSFLDERSLDSPFLMGEGKFKRMRKLFLLLIKSRERPRVNSQRKSCFRDFRELMRFRSEMKYDSTYVLDVFGFLSGERTLSVYQRIENHPFVIFQREREREKFLLRESSASSSPSSTVGVAMQKRSGEGHSGRSMNNFGAVDGQKAID